MRWATLAAYRHLDSWRMAGRDAGDQFGVIHLRKGRLVDESVGMLSVAAVLVFGIWLVDYSGDATSASTSVHAASVEAAHYAASALASPPATATRTGIDQHARGIAERVVGAAAIADCDTADPRFEVAAAVHRLPEDRNPAAISVEVTCPLAVSPLFNDTVSSRVAVPVPEDLAEQR